MPLTPAEREVRHLRRHLRKLVDEITVSVLALDREMQRPANDSRGRRVAAICNRLEMAKDRARMFGLRVRK